MVDVPLDSRSEAGTDARSCLLDRNVVNSAELFQRTCESSRKLVPLMTRSKPGAPAPALFGVKLVIEGILLAVSRIGAVETTQDGSEDCTCTEVPRIPVMPDGTEFLASWPEPSSIFQ